MAGAHSEMYRTLLGIVACLLGALLLVGMTFSASVEEQADFRFVNDTEPKTLDPHLATGEPEGRLLRSIFEGLMRLDAKSLEPIGGVAKSYDLSEDGTRYTFHLRKNAKWTDGHPVTAQDFVYSWKRILDPRIASQYAYILHGVVGARAVNTFGGYVESLRGPIRLGMQKLIANATNGIDARKWQSFLDENHVHAAVEQASDAVLTQRLAKRRGRLSSEELRDTARRLSAQANQLETAYQEALAHFGKDRGIYAPDASTFVVELEAPLPYFLEITTFYPTMPVPRWVVEAPGNQHDWFMPGKIVGNGPFELQSWKVNDRIRLVKSQTYWDKEHTRSNIIDAYPTENLTTALNLYLTGEMDWLPKAYPPDLAPRLRQRPDFYAVPALIVYFYRLNCTRPPFDDPRVRKAVNLAIDRKVITDQVLGRGELPAYHFVPPGMPGYDPPDSEIRFDVDRARQLLAEAGYPGGKGFPEIGILFNTEEVHRKIAEVVSDQLRRNLNIRVNAYNQEWQSYLATVRSLDYDMSRAGWIGDYRDPNTFLDMWMTNGGNNETGFASARYDFLVRAAGNVPGYLSRSEAILDAVKHKTRIERLVDAARTKDPTKRRVARSRLRMALLAEAEAMLVQEDFPVLPVYFYVNSGLLNPKVKGLYTTLTLPGGEHAPNLQDLHPLYSVYKVK